MDTAVELGIGTINGFFKKQQSSESPVSCQSWVIIGLQSDLFLLKRAVC